MENILIATTIISAVILGVTELIKATVSDNKYLPAINVGVGIVVGVIYAVTIVKGDIAIYAWAGALSGLSAGGFYDLGTNSKALVNQSKARSYIKKGVGLKDNNQEDGE